MASIYDRLRGKHYKSIEAVIADLLKYCETALKRPDTDPVVVDVIGTFEQTRTFEPAWAWEVVPPDSKADPKARVRWYAPVAIRQDARTHKYSI